MHNAFFGHSLKKSQTTLKYCVYDIPKISNVSTKPVVQKVQRVMTDTVFSEFKAEGESLLSSVYLFSYCVNKFSGKYDLSVLTLQ